MNTMIIMRKSFILLGEIKFDFIKNDKKDFNITESTFVSRINTDFHFSNRRYYSSYKRRKIRR